MRTTKVILLESIPKLGLKGEIKEVKSGFARNFLVPSKKAIIATEKNLKKAEELKKTTKVEEEKQKKQAEDVKSKLEKASLEIFVPANQEGQLYASVTEKQISEAIKDKFKIDLTPEQIELPDVIKKIGTFNATIDLGFENKVEITLKVIEKKQK